MSMESPDAGLIETAAERLRRAARTRLATAEIAAGIGTVCDCWLDRDFAPRRATVSQIAAAWGYGTALLDESLDALLAPFNRGAIEGYARDQMGGREIQCAHELIGFIMPGNVPGAGLHEVVIALVAGASLLIKTASAEPFFFECFARTLHEADPRIGARIAVFNWNRERTDLTAALKRSCAWAAAFGDDQTLASVGADATRAELPAAVRPGHQSDRMIGFGTRTSATLITREGLRAAHGAELAQSVARDVSLFEQRGCLSPHQVFVEDDVHANMSREFAVQLGAALEVFATRCPPPRAIGLEAAAAVRRTREMARWRNLGHNGVELFESRGLGWAVVYDPNASFRSSPGYRTVTVSAYVDHEDLDLRLRPVAEQLEALAILDPAGRLAPLTARLKANGLSYICVPGMMQSPPLEWRHGRGAFADMLRREQ